MPLPHWPPMAEECPLLALELGGELELATEGRRRRDWTAVVAHCRHALMLAEALAQHDTAPPHAEQPDEPSLQLVARRSDLAPGVAHVDLAELVHEAQRRILDRRLDALERAATNEENERA